MRVAFINENTLGHSSYLLPFARWFEGRPEWGVEPAVVNATPLPASIARWADATVPLMRRWSLDFHSWRWRLGASLHARRQLDALRIQCPIDAAVVNTQSVGLSLLPLARQMPVFVCLDATFLQLQRSPWFAPNSVSRAVSRLPIAALRRKERRLYEAAAGVLPWSDLARDSLLAEYGLSPSRVHALPPSIDFARLQRREGQRRARPQLLFLGGDFQRKGGPLLLECFERHFAERCDLHIVTRSPLAASRNVFIHRGVEAGSREWLERWTQADLFVFPSALETFGIVLLEALAFEVPVIASNAGAAAEILARGEAGVILQDLSMEALRCAIEQALDFPEAARRRAARGRQIAEARYSLERNAARLADLLHGRSAERPASKGQ